MVPEDVTVVNVVGDVDSVVVAAVEREEVGEEVAVEDVVAEVVGDDVSDLSWCPC